MKYNLKSIMHAAWNLYRPGFRKRNLKGAESFAAALRMAWANVKAHMEAKAAAGITEETHTWAGWKERGYEVIHESKALYRVALYDPATKNGTRTTCYFGESQVQPIKV